MRNGFMNKDLFDMCLIGQELECTSTIRMSDLNLREERDIFTKGKKYKILDKYQKTNVLTLESEIGHKSIQRYKVNSLFKLVDDFEESDFEEWIEEI